MSQFHYLKLAPVYPPLADVVWWWMVMEEVGWFHMPQEREEEQKKMEVKVVVYVLLQKVHNLLFLHLQHCMQ